MRGSTRIEEGGGGWKDWEKSRGEELFVKLEERRKEKRGKEGEE